MPGHRVFEVNQQPERPADPAVRQANLRRVGRLFMPYKLRLSAVLTLIVFSAVLGVIPAFLLRDVLNAIHEAAGHEGALVRRWRDDRDRDRHRRARRLADAALEPGRPARDARPARGRLPPPAAAVARVLHAHAHRRGAVADLERHRRRPERRHEHRDLDRVERDDGRGDDGRDAPARAGSSRCSRSR